MASRGERSTQGAEVRTLAKRPKTGGRAKKSIEAQLADAKMRSELAALADDTLLPTELAALYLCMSPKQLADMRSPSNAVDKTRGVDGPPMVKVIDKGAIGQNQAVHYQLGALRDYVKKNTSTTSHEAALNAGLYGFVTTQLPFFAESGAPKRNARDTLIAGAWDLSQSKREEWFKELLDAKIRVVWLTPIEAAASRWRDLSAHTALANIALALLKDSAGAVEAARQFTEIAAATAEAPSGLTRSPH